ncbi:MAG: YlxM family DNA-binding protein [Peptococcaceae bacterium]|nr:YlxM family DNA-binding protein [Peptococcaceae bacterium]
MPLSMNNRNRMICLFDCYGNLLTEKQQTLFNYYFNEDLSLAEISDLVGISRQAVHNSIGRCEETLESFEKTLGVLARSQMIEETLDRTIAAIEQSLASNQWLPEVYEEILAQLKITRKAD